MRIEKLTGHIISALGPAGREATLLSSHKFLAGESTRTSP